MKQISRERIQNHIAAVVANLHQQGEKALAEIVEREAQDAVTSADADVPGPRNRFYQAVSSYVYQKVEEYREEGRNSEAADELRRLAESIEMLGNRRTARLALRGVDSDHYCDEKGKVRYDQLRGF